LSAQVLLGQGMPDGRPTPRPGGAGLRMSRRPPTLSARTCSVLEQRRKKRKGGIERHKFNPPSGKEELEPGRRLSGYSIRCSSADKKNAGTKNGRTNICECGSCQELISPAHEGPPWWEGGWRERRREENSTGSKGPDAYMRERAPSRFERLGELLGTAGEGVLATEGLTRAYTGGWWVRPGRYIQYIKWCSSP
jgi:hypothetical protein